MAKQKLKQILSETGEEGEVEVILLRSMRSTDGSFYYSPVGKVTSKSYITSFPHSSKFDSQVKNCTPLQAYLLEFNFGYNRLK